MLINMISKLISFLLCLGLVACQSNKTYDIVGSWKTTNMPDNTGLEITDKVDFNSDGSYALTLSSRGDSIVKEVKGTYVADKNSQTITITVEGAKFTHKITDLTKDQLKLKTSEGDKLIMKRVK